LAEQKFAIYNESKIPMDSMDSVESIKEQLSRYYPELRNAEGYVDDEGNVRFRVTGGTKG